MSTDHDGTTECTCSDDDSSNGLVIVVAVLATLLIISLLVNVVCGIFIFSKLTRNSVR